MPDQLGLALGGSLLGLGIRYQSEQAALDRTSRALALVTASDVEAQRLAPAPGVPEASTESIGWRGSSVRTRVALSTPVNVGPNRTSTPALRRLRPSTGRRSAICMVPSSPAICCLRSARRLGRGAIIMPPSIDATVVASIMRRRNCWRSSRV